MKRRTHAERERPIKIDVAADRNTQTGAPDKAKPGSTVNERSENSVMGVREFTDDEGRRWRAWPVVPGLTKASASGRQFLGDFQNGWICFEGLGTSARRRLPYHQADWPDISDEELKRLMQQAIDAPVREKKPY